METEIKPKVLKTINTLTKDYSKLIKYQKEKLQSVLNSESFSNAKERGYQSAPVARRRTRRRDPILNAGLSEGILG